MSYKDLQEKAKSLGLPYVGVSAEDLEKSIKEADVQEAKPEKPDKTTEEVDPDPKHNTAIVYNGNNEVRRYELSVHGDNFADLAKQFADSRNYRVELKNVKPGITCPNCGQAIYLDA